MIMSWKVEPRHGRWWNYRLIVSNELNLYRNYKENEDKSIMVINENRLGKKKEKKIRGKLEMMIMMMRRTIKPGGLKFPWYQKALAINFKVHLTHALQFTKQFIQVSLYLFSLFLSFNFSPVFQKIIIIVIFIINSLPFYCNSVIYIGHLNRVGHLI